MTSTVQFGFVQLCGRALQRGRAGSSVQFERRSEPSGRVFDRLFRSHMSHAIPKRAREDMSRATAGPSKFDRLRRAPQWGRASSSGQFELPSEAEVGPSGPMRSPKRSRRAAGGRFERPSETEAASSGDVRAPERIRAPNFERSREAERARPPDSSIFERQRHRQLRCFRALRRRLSSHF